MRKFTTFILILTFISFIIPAISAQDTMKLASWNIRIFSNNSRDNTELRAICRVVRQFDFISIIELRDEEVLKRMIDMLKTEFGRTYSSMVSTPVGTETQKERYAFVFDPSFIRVLRLRQSSHPFLDRTEPFLIVCF